MKRMTRKISLVFVFVGFSVIGIETFLESKHTETVVSPSDYNRGVATSWSIPIPVKLHAINPQRAIDSAEKGILSTVFSRLVKVDSNLEVQPDLLERWEHDLVQKKYILTLRPNIQFHSGKRLLADDVIFSFHYWARKNSLDSNLLIAIKGVKEYQKKISNVISGLRKIDDQTIEVTLENWSDRFILDLAMPRFCIYPERFNGLLEKDFFARPDGTGPFQFKLITKSGELDLYRNDRYYLGSPKIQNLKFFYLDSRQAVAAFNSELVDNLIFYQTENIQKINKYPDLMSVKVRGYKTLTLIVNPLADPELKSREKRQVLLSSLDKSSIIEKCFMKGRVADNLIPVGLVGSELNAKEHNRMLSNQSLLFRTSKKIYIESTINSGCLLKAIDSTIKNKKVSVSELSFEQLFKKFQNHTLSLWIELLEFKNEDPFSVLQYFWNTSSEYLIGIKEPYLASLFDRVSYSKTYGEKASLYREIDHYLVSEYLIYPIAHLDAQVIYRGWIKGLSFSGNRDFLYDWQDIEVVKPKI